MNGSGLATPCNERKNPIWEQPSTKRKLPNLLVPGTNDNESAHAKFLGSRLGSR